MIATVTEAGVLATWQDLGRINSAHHGFGEGGVADCHAALWANRVLGCDSNHPVIEITMGLFAVVFDRACQISITGADLGARINNKTVTPWQTFTINAGDELCFGSPITGLRAYLAIKATFELESVFASSSTVLRENLRGLLGRPLQVGDHIVGQVKPDAFCVGRQVPARYVPNYEASLVLELIAGYQFDQFPAESIEQLVTSPYDIQTNSTRMAYLLKGQAVTHTIASLASEGVAYGAVQIPPDGQPVVLLNDRQTMGGYPKVGCISRLSGAQLAQRFAPTTVRFSLVSLAHAQQAYREFQRFFRQ